MMMMSVWFNESEFNRSESDKSGCLSRTKLKITQHQIQTLHIVILILHISYKLQESLVACGSKLPYIQQNLSPGLQVGPLLVICYLSSVLQLQL